MTIARDVSQDLMSSSFDFVWSISQILSQHHCKNLRIVDLARATSLAVWLLSHKRIRIRVILTLVIIFSVSLTRVLLTKSVECAMNVVSRLHDNPRFFLVRGMVYTTCLLPIHL